MIEIFCLNYTTTIIGYKFVYSSGSLAKFLIRQTHQKEKKKTCIFLSCVNGILFSETIMRIGATVARRLKAEGGRHLDSNELDTGSQVYCSPC